jgi:hypothetical protein
MQDQEKKFLGSILYIGMLIVCFSGGVAYQFKYNVMPVAPQVIEVTKLVNVPQIIETTKVVEVQKDCPVVKADNKAGWFK